MDDHHRHIFGTASWPTEHGNPFNSNVAPVRATAQGQVLWSAPLPTRDGGGVVVAADGRCIVSSGRYLTAIRPGAQVDWTIETELAWVYNPIILPDGRFVRTEEDAIIIRDQSTGAVLASLPVPSHGLALTPDGDLVFTESQEGGNCRLQKLTLEGEVRWSQPQGSWSFDPPLVLEQMIVVGDGSYLRAYDLDGMLLWIANQDGFQHAAPSNRDHL
ncbi:MAG TPA: PQQ-binding-like beta-propeller repeat protein, partial [Roseiflexaceae bacterium]